VRRKRRVVTSSLIVAESLLHGTQAMPLWLGENVIEPNGRAVSVRAVDIFEVDERGAKRRDTYFDLHGYATQMRALVT
jgi:hypothetical protein